MRTGVRFFCSSSPRLPNPPVEARSSTVSASAAVRRALRGDGDVLRTEQHLGGTHLDPIGRGAQDVAQQDLGQLMDEKRRHVDAFAKQREVGRLEARRGGDPLAKAEDQIP